MNNPADRDISEKPPCPARLSVVLHFLVWPDEVPEFIRGLRAGEASARAGLETLMEYRDWAVDALAVGPPL